MKKTWAEFCDWIQGKRVVRTYEQEDYTVLEFGDGSQAKMTSAKTEGSPGYSELTPGSEGHLTTPEVDVLDAGDL